MAGRSSGYGWKVGYLMTFRGARLKAADEAADGVVVADKENFEEVRVNAEHEAEFQAGAAFVDIFAQAADRYSRMEVGLAEAVGQNSEDLFGPRDIRVTQVFERLAKAWAEKDFQFSHALTFR